MNNQHALPLLKFVTSPIFIDDDKDFLFILEKFFKNHNPIMISSKLELEELSLESPLGQRVKDYSEFSTTALIDHFHDEKAKHSTLIIDYDLQETNGLDISNCYSDLGFYRVLLSGIADEKIAVNAFNNGLIEGYISKANGDLFREIKEQLSLANDHYFKKISSIYQNFLSDEEAKLIKNNHVIEFFEGYCQQKNISEYYYLFGTSSFLVIDENGKKFKLSFIYSEHIDHTLDILIDQKAPDDLIEVTRQRSFFPIFPTDDGMYTEEFKDCWNKYLYKPTQLEATNDIFYIISPWP